MLEITMKQLLRILALVIVAACNNQPLQSKHSPIGNWGFLDENLNSSWLYTEIYFNDSTYAIQNESFGTMAIRYWMINDTIYKSNGDKPKLSIGFIESQSKDSLIIFGENGKHTLKRIDQAEKGYFEYENLIDTLNYERYRRDFENRAIKFYISEGWFRTKDESLEIKSKIDTSTILDEFED
ncbi:hypothetical protein ACFSKL_06500 [Belliella marina]|uniref:Uncharacterized protein n=1 Tax=Belliella marina TaxID=1644146 RepID=A0ABW4VJD1_9BACT